MSSGTKSPPPSLKTDQSLSSQAVLYFAALTAAELNAVWLSPRTTEAMNRMRAVEEAHDLGNRAGLGSQREAYARLREQDPKYGANRRRFGKYHALSSLCNLVGFVCTTAGVVRAALNLSSI